MLMHERSQLSWSTRVADQYTYEFPEPKAFLHTLRKYLRAQGHDRIAVLLSGVSCEFSASNQYGSRWNSFEAGITLNVPLERLDAFSDEMRAAIAQAANKIISPRAGYDIIWTEIAPQLEVPTDDDERPGLNAGSVGSTAIYGHDGLRFRSQTEIRLYDELKKRKVLFFPNAAAVLGTTGMKREPDFLVCLNGKWGILEVMGDDYHPASTAMKDHERARLFRDYGLVYIEFYDASRCYQKPAEVVDDFLNRLNQLKS